MKKNYEDTIRGYHGYFPEQQTREQYNKKQDLRCRNWHLFEAVHYLKPSNAQEDTVWTSLLQSSEYYQKHRKPKNFYNDYGFLGCRPPEIDNLDIMDHTMVFRRDTKAFHGNKTQWTGSELQKATFHESDYIIITQPYESSPGKIDKILRLCSKNHNLCISIYHKDYSFWNPGSCIVIVIESSIETDKRYEDITFYNKGYFEMLCASKKGAGK